MALPCYLAMTAGEISGNSTLPPHIAWMACHFSCYHTGLTNIPKQLPPGSVLILNDQIPCHGHDPKRILDEVIAITEDFSCSHVLLDFERPENAQTAAIVRSLAGSMGIPVVVSDLYARESDGPVFLPPAPLDQPLEAYLLSWSGRKVWLEAALCQEEIIITDTGSLHQSICPPDRLSDGHWDEALHCRYQIETGEDYITFTLFDTPETLGRKLAQAEELGVTAAIGLYQQLGRLVLPDSGDTAKAKT